MSREHYAQEKFEQLFLEQIQRSAGHARRVAGRQDGVASRSRAQSPVPGRLRRLSDQARQSLDTLRRLGPRQAWTALRWFVNDRCLAAWLRWRLG